MSETPGRRSPLADLAGLFFRLGTTAFGGPAAHIAMMEDEVVRRRGWLTRAQFLDYLGATNLIPGPNSTELAIHIGHARGGWPGLLVAGLAFILPAALIVAVVAWAYVRFGSLPDAGAVLYGVKPVVIAVVMQALAGLGRAAVKTPALATLGVVAGAAVALGAHEIGVLAAAALAMAIAHGFGRTGSRGLRVTGLAVATGLNASSPAAIGVTVSAAAVAQGVSAGVAAAPVTLSGLFLTFMKIGAVLFGSGYVLLAFLRADFVERLGWLTEAQLLDAIAVGQITPGPVFTTATFIGYLLAGWTGAIVATAGIFLPAFVFVAISGPIVPRLRASPLAGAILDGVNVASLALMAVVSWHLARASIVDAWTAALLAVSVVLLAWRRVNSAWLVGGGAIAGWLIGRA
jgi:chromate transporter